MTDPTSIARSVRRRLLQLVAELAPFGTVRTRDGFLFVNFDDALMGRIIIKRTYEPLWTRFALGWLREGDVAVDVGANFGYYTVVMSAAVGDSGVVVSVEPNPRMVALIRQNARLNMAPSRIDIRGAAVGDHPDGTRLTLKNDTDSTGLASTVVDPAGGVESIRLDDVLSEYFEQVSLLKIDIEGSELSALRGASRLLKSSNPPAVVFEENPRASGYKREQLGSADFLLNCGFELFQEGLGGKLAEASPSDLRVGNVLAMPKRGRCRARWNQIAIAGA